MSRRSDSGANRSSTEDSSKRPHGNAGTRATDEEILAHARVHARSVADEIGVDMADLSWTVSPRAKRRAGACRWDANAEMATIVLSRRAYEAYDRADFESIVRHELIHAWEYQRFGESDHGPRFRERADEFDVSVHCESFTEPRYRIRCAAIDCTWEIDRHRASRPVKTPGRYRCGDCGGSLIIEHVETGRTWESAAGYGGARSALGDDW